MFKVQLLNGDSHTQRLFSEVVNIYAKLKLYILKFCSRDAALLESKYQRDNFCQKKFTV